MYTEKGQGRGAILKQWRLDAKVLLLTKVICAACFETAYMQLIKIMSWAKFVFSWQS